MYLEAAIIVDKSQPPKFVHEEIYTAPGCPHQLSQSLLQYLGYQRFGLTFLSVARKYQKSASQPFLTRIEQLVHQIGFDLDVALQHVVDELSGKLLLIVENTHHFCLFDTRRFNRSHSSRCGHPYWVPNNAAFPQKITGAQEGEYRFF